MTQYNDLLITIALVLFIITALFAIAKVINTYVHNWLCDWHQENTTPKFVALHERIDRYRDELSDDIAELDCRVHDFTHPSDSPTDQG